MGALEIGICVAAILVGAFVKAVTGMGFPLVAIPVISLFVSVEDAVCVIALPNVVMNGVIAWRVRYEAPRTRDLPTLVSTSIVGAVFGTWLLMHVSERVLMIGLALTVFAYVAYAFARPETRLSPKTTRMGSPFVGVFAGLMQGAVGISGPPVAAWTHAYGYPPGVFVFVVSVLFGVAGAAQLAVIAGSGMLAGPRLWLALAALPVVLGMVPIGERMRSRLAPERFGRVVLFVLLVAGVSLIVRGIG